MDPCVCVGGVVGVFFFEIVLEFDFGIFVFSYFFTLGLLVSFLSGIIISMFFFW